MQGVRRSMSFECNSKSGFQNSPAKWLYWYSKNVIMKSWKRSKAAVFWLSTSQGNIMPKKQALYLSKQFIKVVEVSSQCWWNSDVISSLAELMCGKLVALNQSKLPYGQKIGSSDLVGLLTKGHSNLRLEDLTVCPVCEGLTASQEQPG